MTEAQWLADMRRRGIIVTEGKVAAKKPPKYRNRKVNLNGVMFDSQKEADRYIELGRLQKIGMIQNLRMQVRFPLVVNGVKVCSYVADFVFDEVLPDGEWREVIEDVKSPITRRHPVYRIKKKLLAAVCGKHIREV